MTNGLAVRLTRQGWASRSLRGTTADAILDWPATQPTARLVLAGGGAVLIELDGNVTLNSTTWQQVTPDNVHLVTAYLEGITS